MVLSSFLDTFQKIADAATNTKGKDLLLRSRLVCDCYSLDVIAGGIQLSNLVNPEKHKTTLCFPMILRRIFILEGGISYTV